METHPLGETDTRGGRKGGRVGNPRGRRSAPPERRQRRQIPGARTGAHFCRLSQGVHPGRWLAKH